MHSIHHRPLGRGGGESSSNSVFIINVTATWRCSYPELISEVVPYPTVLLRVCDGIFPPGAPSDVLAHAEEHGEEEEEEEAEFVEHPGESAEHVEEDGEEDGEEEEEEEEEPEGGGSGSGSEDESDADELLAPTPTKNDGNDSEENNSDDGDMDDEEERAVLSTNASRSALTNVQAIEEEFFLTYGKKTFGVPDFCIVLQGTPFPCADGREMGHILASKSPDEWEKIKSKHIYVIHADGHDYLYVCFYVPGTPAEDIDKRRLQPVHRPVCKGLVDRFHNSNISEQRKVLIARIMNFQCPPEECGPQINPLSVRWKRYHIEAGTVPTALEKRVSKPRALKGKAGKENDDEPAPKPGLKQSKLGSAGAGASAPAPKPKAAAPAAPKSQIVGAAKGEGKEGKKRAAQESPRDDGSNASTTVAGSSSDARMGKDLVEYEVPNAGPFKRLRSVQIGVNAAKCHVFVMDDKVFIEEHK